MTDKDEIKRLKNQILIEESLGNYLEAINLKGKLKMLLLESREPCVGIFYIVRKEIYWDDVPLREAEVSGYYKIHTRTHPELWRTLRQVKKNFPEDPYYYPRGRVSYNTKEREFEIAADKHIIANDEDKRKIISKFNISGHKVSFVNDKHYLCHSCK